MPPRKTEDDLLEPADDTLGMELPPHFSEAHEQVCALINECDTAGVPTDTILAALMTELMPRLVQAYGPSGVATMLNHLASEISGTGDPPVSIQ
jgi:hypothetical protein